MSAGALKTLHGLGARFATYTVDAEGKKEATAPNMDKPGGGVSLAKAQRHKGPVGTRPEVLSCVMIDVDYEGQKAVDAVVDILGPPLLQLPTRREDGWHLWYGCIDAASVPSGKWQHGEICAARNAILWGDAADKLAEALTRTGKPGEPITPAKITPQHIERLIEAMPYEASPVKVKVQGRVRDYRDADWSEGGRNDLFYSLCLNALENGDAALADEIKQWVVEQGHQSEREATKTYDSALKKAQSKGPGTRIANAWTARGLANALAAVGVELRWNIRAQRFEYRRGKQWEQATDRLNAWLRQVIQERCSTKKGTSLQPLKYAKDTFNDLRDALGYVAEVDPFIEKLEGLPAWDGTPRIDTLLTNMFGAEDTPLVRWASRYAGMAAVQRALEPGCKLDEVPVLLGAQGCGKSAFIRCWLEEHEHEWHGDAVDLAGTEKEQAEQMKGRVLIELSELVGMRRAEVERLKSFITRRNDGQHRGAYARDPEPFLRRVALLGTTNEQEALPNDPSGNRRFVVVELTYGCDVEGKSEGRRGQWWAEALHRYRAGERANLPRVLMDEAKSVAEVHRGKDAMEDEVRDAAHDLEHRDHQAGFTLRDLHLAIAGQGAKTADMLTQRRYGAALLNTGFRKKRVKRDGGWCTLWFSTPSSVPTRDPDF